MTPPLAAGSYIWLETAAKATFSSLTYTLSVDLATTATTKTVSGLENGKSYEVQIRAATATSDSEWSTSATGAVGAPGTPSDLTLVNDDGRMSVNWRASEDNGSAVTDYDMRYSSDGGDTWSEFFDGGMASGTNKTSDTSDGAAGDPIDLGEIVGLSIPFTRGTVDSNYGVYKLGGSVDKLWFQVVIHYSPGFTYYRKLPAMQARYASTMPTADNLMTHGTQLWSWESVFGFPNFSVFGAAFTPPLAADTYFWVVMSEAETVIDSKYLIYADLASTATSATVAGLTSEEAYQVQVRAANSRGVLFGEGSWSSALSVVPSLDI